MYGSAALLHRGIYASVRIRASRDSSRSAAGTATPEVVTVLPGTRCKCADDDDERRTLPSRRRCCREDCGVADAAVDTRSRNSPSFGLPRDTAAAAGAKTRSLIVVARPGVGSACPECHTVSLVSNAGGQNTEQHRNYGTAITSA